MATLKDLIDEQERQKQLLAMMAMGGDERALGNYPPQPAQQPSQGNYSDMFDPSIPLPPAKQYTGNTLADIARNPNPNWSQETKDALARRADLSGTLRISHNGQDVSDLFGGGGGQPQQPAFRNTLQIGDNAPVNLGQSQPAGPAMDYSMPIEIGGMGKGYRLKGDATRAVLADGRIIDMGRDTGAERARMKEDLGMEKTRAEIANMQKPYESAEDKAFAREAAKTKGEADRAKQAAGIPGTPEYKKIQAENSAISQAKTTKENFDRHADAYIKNIDMLIGDSETNKEHVGLRGAVGSIDAALPDWLSTQNQVDARRLGEGLLNKASVAGLKDIRSEGTAPGSITEKEWPIFQTQGEIMSMSQSKDQYKKALKDKREEIIQSKARVARNYEERVGKYGVQPASPAAAPVATDRGAVIEQNGTQYMVMSRNADGSAVIKDPKTGKTGIWRP